MASAQPPWQAADSIRADLAEAQTKQLFGEDGGNEVRSAEASLRGPLRAGLKASAPAELAEIETALAAARGAAAQGDEVGLAARRGEITAALRRGAMAVAVAAAARGEVAEARSWMQIRDFRKTTRFTRPGVNGTEALEKLKEGEISRHETVLQIEKDLLDSFQARLLTNLDEAGQAAERGFGGRFAEPRRSSTAIGRRSPRSTASSGVDRNAPRRIATSNGWRRPSRGRRKAFEIARERVEADLEGFTAAPLTPEEQVNRASQLERFEELVPKEFDKGTSDNRVTVPFEIQEAVAFMDGVEAAFSDLEPFLLVIQQAAVARIEAAHEEMRADVDNAQEGKAVADQEEAANGTHQARSVALRA